MTTVGLLLAAGAGRRMGGPKALLRLTPAGPTLIETAVERLWQAGCDRVVAVVGAGASQASDAVARLRVDVVTAPDWDEGMGASLRAGLEHLLQGGARRPAVAMPHAAPAEALPALAEAAPTPAGAAPDTAAAPDLALVTLVDLPDVTAEVMARVLAAAQPQGAAALVRAAYGGVPGHPVAIGRDHWDAVRTTARGDRGARDHLRTTVHDLVECGDLATGHDVDTVADLAARANHGSERSTSDRTQQ